MYLLLFIIILHCVTFNFTPPFIKLFSHGASSVVRAENGMKKLLFAFCSHDAGTKLYDTVTFPVHETILASKRLEMKTLCGIV